MDSQKIRAVVWGHCTLLPPPLVNALRSEQIWPSNVRNCPQSWALGQHVSWKTAPHLACSIDVLQIEGREREVRVSCKSQHYSGENPTSILVSKLFRMACSSGELLWK